MIEYHVLNRGSGFAEAYANHWQQMDGLLNHFRGGAAVVVRGWESQPHGKGRQDVSFWIAEGFAHREGSR